MSQVLEIFVNGILLDLSPGEVIEKNYQTFNLLNIGTSQGNFTSTFRIPATPRNKSALGFPANSPVQEITPRTLNSCHINQRGLPVIEEGFLVVGNADQDNIDCTIYSGSINAFIDFTGEEKIRDLVTPENPFPIGDDYVWDLPTIYAGRNGQFPLIDWGANMNDQGGIPQTDIRSMAFVVSLRSLIQSIFWLHPNPRLARRNIVGPIMSNQFFNSLAIPFSGNEQILPDTAADVIHYFRAENLVDNVQNLFDTTDQPRPIFFQNVIADPNGRYNQAEAIYTVDPAIALRGKFRMEVLAQSYRGNEGSLRIFIESSSKGLLVERTVNLRTGAEPSKIFVETDPQTFETGEQITFLFQVDFGDPNALFMDWLMQTGSFVSVILTDANAGEGDTVIIKDNLPDISQLQLIQEWVTMFGLILLPDPNFDIDPDAPVQIFQFADLARNFPLARQWSRKIDTNKSITINHHFSQYAQANEINWAADDQIETPIGNGVWSVTDEALDKVSVRHVSIFAPSQEVPFPLSLMQLAQVRTFDETFAKVETPGIRLVCLTPGSGELVEWNTGAGGDLGATDYLIAHFLSGLPSGQTLSWNNLLDQSYREFTAVLNKGYLLELSLFLNETDLFSLDFLRPIFLEGRIQNVDLNGFYYLVQVEGAREDQTSTPCLLAKIPEQPFTLFLDADAADYISRMAGHGITFTQDQEEAINGYIQLAKDPVNGWWNQLFEDWVFFGDNEGGQTEGLKAGANALSFVNTIPSDHLPVGWISNGVDSYAIFPETAFNIVSGDNDEGCFEIYINTDVDAGISPGLIGAEVNASERLLIQTAIVPGNTYCYIYMTPRLGEHSTSSVQFSMIANRHLGTSQFWRAGLKVEERSGPDGTAPALAPYLGAYNLNGVPTNFAKRQFAGSAIFTEGLTDLQVEAFNNARQLLNEAFFRGASFALDPDALIFAARAASDGFPFPQDIIFIIDNYVKSLKAAGAWGQIDHLWPFFGDNIVQHRINLKLPTAPFDLGFVNTQGQDFGASGWRPNGVNSYALTPAFPKENNKASFYVTEIPNQDGTPDFGCRLSDATFDLNAAVVTINNNQGRSIWRAHDTASFASGLSGAAPMVSGARFSINDNRMFNNGIQTAQNVTNRVSPAPQLSQALGAVISGGFQSVLDLALTAGLKAISVLGDNSVLETIKFDVIDLDTLGFYSAATGLWTTTRTISARFDGGAIGIIIGSNHVTVDVIVTAAGSRIFEQTITRSQFVEIPALDPLSLVAGNSIAISVDAVQGQQVTQASFYGSIKPIFVSGDLGRVSYFPYSSNDVPDNNIRGWSHVAIPFPGRRPGSNPARGHTRTFEGTYFDDPQTSSAFSFSSWTVGAGGAGQYRIQANVKLAFLVSGAVNNDWVNMTLTIGRFGNATSGGNPLEVYDQQIFVPPGPLEFKLDSGLISLNDGDIIRLSLSQTMTGTTPFGTVEIFNEDVTPVEFGGSMINSATPNFDSWLTFTLPGDKPWTSNPGVPERNREVTILPGERSEILYNPPGLLDGNWVDPQGRRTLQLQGNNDQFGTNESTTWIELWAKRFDAPTPFKLDEIRMDQVVGGATPGAQPNWGHFFSPVYADFVEFVGVAVREEAGGVATTLTLRSHPNVFNFIFSAGETSWFSIGRANFDMKLFAINRNFDDNLSAAFKMSEQQINPSNFSNRRFGSLALLSDNATPQNVIDEALTTMQNQVALGRAVH